MGSEKLDMWKDSESNIDFIDFEYIADLVNHIIMDESLLPASIGVYGDWGSGKSSIMSISQNSLKELDKSIMIINFNAWLFEDYGDTKKTVINRILDELEIELEQKEKPTNKLVKLRRSVNLFDLSSLLVKNSPTIMSTIINPLNFGEMTKTIGSDLEAYIRNIKENYEALTSHKSLRDDISNFREQFGALIQESGLSRVVIYIDEMDRCLPDTILEIFEAMRLFLFDGKVAFVFGADERQISYAIRQKYSDSIFDVEHKINIGKEYLEKIIQYPIRIPTMTVSETEMYLTLLFCSKLIDNQSFANFKTKCIEQFRLNTTKFQLPDNIELSDREEILDAYSLSKRISSLLNSGLNGNPRQFKRFLNEFEMRKNVAEFKNIKINEQVLVKMMMLQYVKPNIFMDFIDLYGKGELDLVLNAYKSYGNVETKKQKNTNSSHEKKWKDDWFEKWMNEAPNIEQENLEPYFYLSRNTNTIFNYVSNIKLSDSAAKIIDAYLGDSDILITRAQGLIKEISEAECNTMIDVLYNSFITNKAKKNINVIKGIVEIVQTNNQCFREAVSKLKLIPANNITKAMIVHVEALKTINEVDINSLLEIWDDKNKKII
jgi:KAP P-loop protein